MLELKPSSALRHESRPRRTTAALLALGVLSVAAPQMLAGTYPWGMLATALCAAAVLGLVLASDPERGPAITPLTLTMIAALGWTLIQATPLPCGVTEHVAPAAAEHLRRSHRLLELDEPRLCTLSQNPGATREEIVKGIAIISAFLAASALARRGHRRWVYGSVALSGTVLALVALVHLAVGAERVFGWYEPIDLRKPPLLAPVLNPNNLGGLLAMCVPLLVGLALAVRSSPARLSLLLSTGVVVGCVFMTRSRGAIGAVFLGLALLVLLARSRRSKRQAASGSSVRQRVERIAVPVGVAAAFGVSAYGWHQEIVEEFQRGDWDKLQMIAAGARFTLAYPWIGVGRGAFGSVFAAVHNTPNRFEHAENFVVQWISEWGFPVALALLLALSHAALRAAWQTRSLDRIGALAGIVVFAVQNLLDLGLELVGLATPAALLLGAALAERPQRRGATKRASVPRGMFWFGMPMASAGLIALLWVPVQRDHSAYLVQELNERWVRGDRSPFHATLRNAVTAHPSEPMFAVLAASEALRHRDAGAGHWINRAMQLAPGWPLPHLQAAQWLLHAGRHEQALLELGVAAKLDPWGSRVLLCPVAERDLQGVLALAPTREHRLLFYSVLGSCFGTLSEHSAQIDDLILRASPENPHAHLRAGSRELAAGDAMAALAAAERALVLPETRDRAIHLKARALSALGQEQAAVRVLRQGERMAADPSPLVALQARIHAAREDTAAMGEALARLRGLAGGRTEQMRHAYHLEAELQRKLGNQGAVLAAFEEAYRITGDTSALRGIAEAARRLGDRGRAAWAYGELCVGGDPHGCKRKGELLGGESQAELPDKAVQPPPR